uniref:BAALC binder of MAP3K1 and KLF4 b n=1 Tax=Poecilia latipinna TaxID=48699 RepID=A0A3B3VBQ1_9TELE
MGCGGSRADAIIEPRYHESWTRETESTWLTNTDVEPPVSVPNSKLDSRISRFAGLIHSGHLCLLTA